MSPSLSSSPAAGAALPGRGPELTVVIPTFNERDNVPLLIERLDAALGDVAWEAIVVDDDSADGTASLVKEIGARDSRVRCIRRVGRRGLSGACIEGMLAAQGDVVAVIDADLQHDERILRAMVEVLRRDEADVVVGSRYVSGGEAAGLSGGRLRISRLATHLARWVLGVSLADPMSGFFALRRTRFEALAPRLSAQGFKILMDILVSARGSLRVREIAYQFRPRLHGASKLDSRIALDFLGLLVAKATGDLVPVRFVSFLLVGASGVLVHLLVLRLALAGLTFPAAQSVATLCAATSNFALNNALTYRDQRLKGLAMVRGLFAFYGVCAIGALSNIGVASWLYANRPVWWLAGVLGSLVGAVWNYAVSSALVWKVR